MNGDSTTDVPGVASHALFGRMLFVYCRNGVVKCFSADEIRPLESAMLDIGWRHTATIDPARWIEAMANGNTEPSDMLDELRSPDRAVFASTAWVAALAKIAESARVIAKDLKQSHHFYTANRVSRVADAAAELQRKIESAATGEVSDTAATGAIETK